MPRRRVEQVLAIDVRSQQFRRFCVVGFGGHKLLVFLLPALRRKGRTGVRIGDVPLFGFTVVGHCTLTTPGVSH